MAKKEIIYNDKGQEVCGAKRRGDGKGKLCQDRAILTNGRCKIHGGKALTGIAHPGYKTGKHCKLLPKNLRGKYQEAIDDPKLLELRSEIALAETRRQDLMEQLNKGNYGETFAELNKLYVQAEKMKESGDTASFVFLLPRMKELLDGAESTDKTWNMLMEVEDHKRKLTESETKRMVAVGQVLTMEQTFILMQQVGHLIKELVTDKEALRKISMGLGKLMGGVE